MKEKSVSKKLSAWSSHFEWKLFDGTKQRWTFHTKNGDLESLLHFPILILKFSLRDKYSINFCAKSYEERLLRAKYWLRSD